MVKEKKGHIDYFLLAIVSSLLILGILVSAQVSAEVSQQIFHNANYYLFHQLIYGMLVGLFLGFITFLIPLSFIKKWSWLFILFSLFLMVLVFLPFLRTSSNGASRWLKIGHLIFQPSELLKISFIIYVSALLTKKTSDKRRGAGKIILFPFLAVIILIIILLYFQSDLSTLGVITLSGIIIYFISETPIIHNILVFLGGTVIFILFILLSPYRLNRVLVYFGKIRDPLSSGYQIKQVLIAIGSGGILGLGLGVSHQAKYLPHPMSDSVFALIAEELGLIGSLFLILLFFLFFWRGIKIAKNSGNKFYRLFAAGFVSWITIQAIINIGSMIGILPLTGIPLPFISYGGSHIVVELIGVSILLNISRYSKK